METFTYIEEKNKRDYMTDATKNIDRYIKNNDYKRAFSLFLLTIEKLDQQERQVFIDYYNLKIIN